MVTASLSYAGKQKRYFELLIDSGADYTLVSRFDAQILGLDYDSLTAQHRQIEIANMHLIDTKEVQMDIEIVGKTFAIPVLIAEQEVGCLLGRKGVFDTFDVLFQQRKQSVVFQQ